MAKPINSAPALVPRATMMWLIAGFALAIAPHIEYLPVWLSSLAGVLLVWRIYLAWHSAPLPNRWLLFALTAIVLAGIVFTFRSIFGREPGVALVVIFLALKLLETRSRRDVMVVVFLSYFVVLTSFLDSQTILMAALALLTLLVITATLVGVSQLKTAGGIKQNFRVAIILALQSIPLMLALFFLFPRVQGPLWGMPADANSTLSGLSDTMQPGSIGNLTLSDAIAFRVQFNNAPPEKAKLYWRGPVLSAYDGRIWQENPLGNRQGINLRVTGSPVEYAVTLEPHNRRWLFALEMPSRAPQDSFITSDFQLLSRSTVRSRIRYELRSYPDYVMVPEESGFDPVPMLQLPAGFNPKTLALGREWQRTLADPEKIVLQALSKFRNEPFVYTLRPPLLGRDAADEFLFSTQRGFCEHYASAFVILMRAAGVPARVVTGYQGGDINPIDGFMIVRQSEAHAWAEVWLAGKGWVRIDPTAAVAPSRIERGLDAAVPLGDPTPFMSRSELNWVRSVRYNWEAVTNEWNQWVLGYTPERQRQVLSKFGMGAVDWMKMGLLLLTVCTTMLAAIALWMLRRNLHAGKHDAVVKAWLAFCKKMERIGIKRQAFEGPLDFSARISREAPHFSQQAQQIANLYADLRYGAQENTQLVKNRLKELRMRIKEFIT